MYFDDEIISLVAKSSALLADRGMSLVTAESCTGGLVSALITDLPGSSKIFDRGFVTYSNTAKKQLLGVFDEILENHGAVSAECAKAMARGALLNSNADISASVTGIAGPGGASKNKPLGLVYIGIAKRRETSGGGSNSDTNKNDVVICQSHKNLFNGDRQAVREQSCAELFRLLIKTLYQEG